jgi:hypothetical protein
MSIGKITEAANLIAETTDSALILYNGPIDYNGFGGLLRALQVSDEQPRRTNALLILSTLGGSANAGYQIARALQQGFSSFSLYVPHRCKSAGTLVSLGASEVIMDDIAELGPLDVQLIQRDEIGRRRSGLILRNAFDGLSQATLEAFEKIMLGIKAGSGGVVSFETASRIAAEIASQVMAPVYAQISPEALGNDLRDLNIATEYGNRLVSFSSNADHRAVDRLVHHYPAHDFIIDREEASQLFKSVISPSDNLVSLTMLLGEAVYLMRDESLVVRLDRKLEEQNDAGVETGPETKAADSVLDARLEGAGDSNPTSGGA